MSGPERIYLQYGAGRTEAEVSWCSERVDDSDVEYVRADKVDDAFPWVSVSERLPDNGQVVLASWRSPFPCYHTVRCVLTEWGGKREAIWHRPDSPTDQHAQPTHWMLPPKAPESHKSGI